MTKLLASLIALLLVLVFVVGYWIGRPAATSGNVLWSTGPTVTHLESLGELVAMRVSIADVLEAKDEDYRGSWLIKGDALISVDMTKAKIVASDPLARTATIQLPKPKVLSPRVNHERSMTWKVEKLSWSLWKGDPDAMRDLAMGQAQKLIETEANSKEHLAEARTSAEQVIAKLYRMVDWRITVEWDSN